MLFNLDFSLGVLLLVFPVAVLSLAWARTRHFYDGTQVSKQGKAPYLAALALASASTIAYLCYWGWWVSSLYQISLSVQTQMMLERAMRAGGWLGAASIGCLVVGKGPFRPLVGAASIWVTLQLCTHSGLVHWS